MSKKKIIDEELQIASFANNEYKRSYKKALKEQQNAIFREKMFNLFLITCLGIVSGILIVYYVIPYLYTLLMF